MKNKPEVLYKKYPNLFKESGPQSGFYIGKGWMPLVETLCAVINGHISSLPEEVRGEFEVVQVKEKFGGLRFYLNHETPFISGAISMAESMSFQTCEECGKPGIRRSASYIRTLCNLHHKKFSKGK